MEGQRDRGKEMGCRFNTDRTEWTSDGNQDEWDEGREEGSDVEKKLAQSWKKSKERDGNLDNREAVFCVIG